MTCKKAAVAKGEIVKKELVSASSLDAKERNPDFGFKCTHYCVSEGSDFIRICIENKRGQDRQILVKTQDVDATGGEDYESIHKILDFKKHEKEKFVEIKIYDDDHWEPDEDFKVILYDLNEKRLEGIDCETIVTIIDDDKPG